MIFGSIFYNAYFYLIGLYHIYISPYFIKIHSIKDNKKQKISHLHYFMIILLCLIKSVTRDDSVIKSLFYFIIDNSLILLEKNFVCRFFMNKFSHIFMHFDTEHDYYIEYPCNNRIVKGIYTHNKLYDIVKNINDSYEYLNSNAICAQAIIGVSINDVNDNIVSIKSILNEYIFNSTIKDILKFENVHYNEKSILRVVSIELLKKKECTVNLVSVHNENKMKIYNIE